MTYHAVTPSNCRIRAIDNMGITLNATPNAKPADFDPRVIVRVHLARLTPRELEVCVLHFVECRSQLLIAEWLGISDRSAQRYLRSAVKKIPQLKRLQTKSLTRGQRPKIFHLSQLRETERGPFNADEV